MNRIAVIVQGLLVASLGAALIVSPEVRANCALLPGNPEATPDARFTVNGDGTVTDLQTALMWSQALLGSASTQVGAVAAAEASTLAGHADWRLPTRAELVGLVETGCARPALNTSRFTAGSASVVWSSTAGPGTTVWFVDFTYGSDAIDPPGVLKGVRLVRSATGAIFSDGFE
jgi:hypothetical protein